MIYDGPGQWTDVTTHQFFKPPHVIYSAAEIAAMVRESPSAWDAFLHPRVAIYTSDAGDKYPLELTFVIQPAVTTAIYTIATSTSLCEGRFIGEDGAFTAAAGNDNHYTCAGMLLGKYYAVDVERIESPVNVEPFTIPSLTEGMGYWAIRRGAAIALNVNGGNTAVGDRGILGGAAADIGGLVVANAMAGPTAAQIVENLWMGDTIGRWRAVVADDALGRFDLHMPGRFRLG